MAAQVPDGTDSSHPYECQDENGVAVPSVEAIKYRVVDKNNADVLAWTPINPPVPSGTIEVPGEINRVRQNGDTIRKITIVAKHDGGKNKTGEIVYELTDFGGIQTTDDLLIS